MGQFSIAYQHIDDFTVVEFKFDLVAHENTNHSCKFHFLDKPHPTVYFGKHVTTIFLRILGNKLLLKFDFFFLTDVIFLNFSQLVCPNLGKKMSSFKEHRIVSFRRKFYSFN